MDHQANFRSAKAAIINKDHASLIEAIRLDPSVLQGTDSDGWNLSDWAAWIKDPQSIEIVSSA